MIQILWLYALPVFVGFVSIAAYQMSGRIAMAGPRASKKLIFLSSLIAFSLSLFGWALIVRTISMIPLYGCGAGLANVTLSRLFAITLRRHPRWNIRLPKMIWWHEVEEVNRFREGALAQANADCLKYSPQSR